MLLVAALLLCGVSTATVPPPTDVIVTCNNFKTSVSWKYSEQQPPTSFIVYVDTDAKPFCNNTTDHECDLSSFVWESEQHYLDALSVTVTAVQEGNQSELVESQLFTFNSLKTASLTCGLDFPPDVQLTVEELRATVRFRNPLHFYKELKQVTKQEGASFEFSVCTEREVYDASCTVEDDICEHSFSFPEGVEQFVTLKGTLCSKNCMGKVLFKQTEPIYPTNPTKVLEVTLALMLGILIFIIVVVTAVICKVKVWTVKEKPPPRCLQMEDFPPRLLPPHPHFCEMTAAVTLTSSEVNKRCSFSSEDYDDDPTDKLLDQSSFSQSRNVGYQDGNLSDSNQDLASGDSSTDGVSTDNSGETECVSMDFEEHCNYDSPKFVKDIDNTR
ncbi:interferon gamma receptor 1 isoform X1 [Anabas testudineus]|uniref:interferon gamma receptor 1 isoform X1 n=1 Tax=Anabas testudineus TaxID=64144 RepID=UPI000E464E2A|nr:interferon gamma receptor 1 isoform X1 [Anabas testudineus]